jgi:hypothetical protein
MWLDGNKRPLMAVATWSGALANKRREWVVKTAMYELLSEGCVCIRAPWNE